MELTSLDKTPCVIIKLGEIIIIKKIKSDVIPEMLYFVNF